GSGFGLDDLAVVAVPLVAGRAEVHAHNGLRVAPAGTDTGGVSAPAPAGACGPSCSGFSARDPRGPGTAVVWGKQSGQRGPHGNEFATSTARCLVSGAHAGPMYTRRGSARPAPVSRCTWPP